MRSNARPSFGARVLLITLGSSAIWALPANSQVLDQSSTGFARLGLSLSQTSLVAQTYTAGITGELAYLNLVVAGTSGTVTVQIRNVVSALPGPIVLGSAVISTDGLNSFPGLSPVVFSPTVPQVAGTQYSIVMTASCGCAGWWGNNPDPYPGVGEGFLASTDGGISWTHSTSYLPDFFFQTFVIPSGPQYVCVGFADPFDLTVLLKKRTNRAIPLQIQLRDGASFVTGASLAGSPPVVNVTYSNGLGPAVDVTDELDPIGSASEGNQFAYSGGRWYFNLGTRPFSAAGTYTVSVAPGDAAYLISPTCTGQFVRGN